MNENTFIAGPSGNLEVAINEQNPTRWAILCHPHPLYGGNMDDAIVRITETALKMQRFSTLRFNFRGTGFSAGKHDNGIGEVDDLMSIYDWVVGTYKPEQVIVAGYSFGSIIAAQAASQIKSNLVLLLAPPTRGIQLDFLVGSKVIAIVGSKDDFVDDEILVELAAKLSSMTVTVVEGADHFFTGEQANLFTIIESELKAHVL